MIGFNRHRASRGVIFARSAGKHGFTEEDVSYASEHPVRIEYESQSDGTLLVKLVGLHRDPLVPYIEVLMRQSQRHGLVIFHVSALTDNFWD
jgi:hypothetical protein